MSGCKYGPSVDMLNSANSALEQMTRELEERVKAGDPEALGFLFWSRVFGWYDWDNHSDEWL